MEICSIAPFCFLFGLNILIKFHFMLFLRKMRKCADLSSTTPCTFLFFPCSLPILHVIAATSHVKLDILATSSFTRYNLWHTLHYARISFWHKFGTTFLCYRCWISVSCHHMTRKSVMAATKYLLLIPFYLIWYPQYLQLIH